MKHGSQYAKQVKRVYNRLVRQHGKPKHDSLADPIEQLLLGVLARGTTETAAAAAMKRLQEGTVDLNELRVASPREMVQLLGENFPSAIEKARDINSILNEIFNRQHELDLDFLRDKTRREAKDYLQKMPGVDACTVARVMLVSVGGHAIPVDENILSYLRKQELVDPEADEAEVQAFLERNIAADDAYAFYTLVRRLAASSRPRTGKKAATTKKKTKKASKAKRSTASRKSK
jgi:endonuclease III